MQRLIATFDVSLSSPLFVNRPNRPAPQQLRYPARIDESDVEIALLEVHHAQTKGDKTLWAVPQVRVSVSRTETAEPPPLRGTLEGENDRAVYFRERTDIYQKVTLEALRRFLGFFKYRQAHGLLRDATAADMRTLTWTDETGQELPSKVDLPHVLSLYGIELDEDVGIKALAAADDPELQQALTAPIQPEPYEELLADARAALFQGHLPRAILELAVSCEVVTKQAFSGKATEAALAKYFDERRQVRDTVGGFINLLGEPAEHILGQNFRKTEKRAYAHIDHLFQCRNQIAHGERKYTYRNKRGYKCPVDQSVANEWFKSADRLFTWLRRMRP